MFDAHILYYSYDNIEGDEYCIGLFGNKQFWINLINRWEISDGKKIKHTIEEWDELDTRKEFRGCQLAELEPDGKDYLVRWVEQDKENEMRISPKTGITWENNPQNKTSVPRWITRLKTAMKENSIT